METSERGSGKIEPGDSGIWVTCVKGKEGKATQELKVMFDEVSWCSKYVDFSAAADCDASMLSAFTRSSQELRQMMEKTRLTISSPPFKKKLQR